nr:MAG: nonstructural protein [Army ant associated chapparvovirus 6]
MYNRNRKAWFAMRAKLQREGKWKHTRPSTEPTPDPKRKSPDPDPGELSFPNCLTPSMFDNEYGGDEEISVSSQFDTELHTPKPDPRKMPSPVRDISESEDECENSQTKKVCIINHTVLHEDRNTQSSARKVELALRNRTDCRGHFRGGVSGIFGSEADMATRIMFSGPDGFNFKVFDSETLLENLPLLAPEEFDEVTSYFQTYNSLAIVIRTLPNTTIFTVDILNYLHAIKDPYMIICEKSANNVWHWHMIWFTDKRSDNAKRTLMGLFNEGKPGSTDIISPKLSISIQQTKSFKHLLVYILKSPIVVAVRNDNNLWELVGSRFRIDKPTDLQKPEVFPNTMVKEIIECMRTHMKYTCEELMQCSPAVMRKYLHRSNIEGIIQNCKMYLLAPTDIDTVYGRITQKVPTMMTCFHIYAYLIYQNVLPETFIMRLFKVLFMEMDKINCFVIQGPSNTGKTSFLNGLLSFYNWGEIQSSGPFMFQNCVNRELLLWEEPLIGHDYVENCKKVFEGMATQVSVKYKPAQTLYRTPVLITTNKDLWHYTSVDESAIKNRIFLYNFRYPADEFPEWLRNNYADSRSSYKQFITGISNAITELLKRPRSRAELDESACSSDCSADSQSIYSGWEQPDSNNNLSLNYREQLYHSTCFRLLKWWNDNGRASGSKQPNLYCTERERSSSSDSSSTDDEWIRPNFTAGDSSYKRRYSHDERSSAGPGPTDLPGPSNREPRRDRLRGRDRRKRFRSSIGGVLSSGSHCPKFIKEFYTLQFGSGFLKKVPESKSITTYKPLDWVFDQSSKITQYNWLCLIKLMWYFQNACRGISDR